MKNSEPKARAKIRPRPLFILLYLAMTCAIVFGAVEILGRLLFPEPKDYRPYLEAMYKDAAKGERDWAEPYIQPNTVARHLNVDAKTNSLGYRGREVPMDKNPGVIRIAAFGDSFVFGHGLEVEDTLPFLLEGRLEKKRPGAEVLNFGICGLNSFQEVMYAMKFGMKFHPDILLVVWFVNDVEAYRYVDEDLEAFKRDGVLRQAVTHETFQNLLLDDMKKLDGPPQADGIRGLPARAYSFLKKRSRLVQILADGGRRRKTARSPGEWAEDAPGVFSYQHENLNLSAESLIYLSGEMKKRGVEFYLFLYPQMDHFEEGYEGGRLYESMASIAGQRGVPAFNLYPYFANQSAEKLRLDINDAHPNRKASEIAAQAMEKILMENSPLLSKPPDD